MSGRLTVFGVPTSRASHTGGQEKAPAVLRRAGIIGLLNARGFDLTDFGDLPITRFTPDPSSPRAQNVADVVRVVSDVRALVARSLGDRRMPLVLGGDCTIVLGVLGGILDAGREPVLAYFDAHGDLNVPDQVRFGALDWMGLAHALNLPGAVAELAGVGPRTPLLEPDAIALVGTVPSQLTEWEQRVIAERKIAVTGIDAISTDPAGAALAARRALEQRGDALWVHFDVDSIDSIDLPVADFFQLNAGLPFTAAMQTLGALLASPKLAGITVSQFNPDHADEGGADAARFVRGLVDAMATGSVGGEPA